MMSQNRPKPDKAKNKKHIPQWNPVEIHCGMCFVFGAGNRNRTCNLLITNQLHCQLCYASGNLYILARSGGCCQPGRAACRAE